MVVFGGNNNNKVTIATYHYVPRSLTMAPSIDCLFVYLFMVSIFIFIFIINIYKEHGGIYSDLSQLDLRTKEWQIVESKVFDNHY